MSPLRLVVPRQATVPSERQFAAHNRRRVAHRWITPFGKFVNQLTVRGLLRAMHQRGYPISAYAIYHWLDGSTCPRVEHAIAMVKISQGSISLDDIYSQRERVRIYPDPTPAPAMAAA